ncbi:MAG TPA: endonuclease/exonuclease/phosphatase family protein [Polyangiales bacterium]|jgi:endonuclease/exonuclease/phosphatase family metal-dependent hydrolase|nr:endonuclease/exonuclease/phosphatase family protein [Polyangiales bacterium]
MSERIAVLTYNIRKGKGADGRSSVQMTELGKALRGHPIDLVLCQEVFHCARTGSSQSSHLAQELGFDSYYGGNKFREIGHHGNTTLTKLRVRRFENHDISTNRIEKRGALYVCVSMGKRPLHVFNVHLGLNQWQRASQVEQVAKIMSERCKPGDPVLLAGDFNDWHKKLDRTICEQLGFRNAFEGHDERAIRTWHSRRPVFSLDRIYLKNLRAERAERLHGEPWSVLSDHLPLWAELSLTAPGV